VTVGVDDARRLLLDATSTDGERAPQARAFLERVWPDIIELCSVDPSARAALADLQDSVAALGEEHEGAHWIGIILAVLHDEPFVAIEPDTQTGIIGRMSGVVDNFQLHTLLMEDVPGKARRVSPSAAAIARGLGPQTSDETIVGAWNLYTFRGLRGGSLPEADDTGASDVWIWNEGTPSDIPLLDGHRVILLGPPGYERSWAAQRTFPNLPATLNATPLEASEVDEWLTRAEAVGR
jgi:hypothetical protein